MIEPAASILRLLNDIQSGTRFVYLVRQRYPAHVVRLRSRGLVINVPAISRDVAHIDGLRFALDEPMTPEHLRVARKYGLCA